MGPTRVAAPSNRAGDKARFRGGAMTLAAGASACLLFAIGLVLARHMFGGRSWAFWLETTAAPWVAVAFAVGALARRPAPGAGIGALSLAVVVVVHDSVSLSMDGVQLMFLVRPFWLYAAIAVGATCGALGGWWRSGTRTSWVPLGLVGGVIAGEAWALFAGGPLHSSFAEWTLGAQAAAGVALSVADRERWIWSLIVAVLIVVTMVVFEAAGGLVTRVVWG